MTAIVDLTSQHFFRDPGAAMERLRAADPVVEISLPIIGRVWMTTTQDMAAKEIAIAVSTGNPKTNSPRVQEDRPR